MTTRHTIPSDVFERVIAGTLNVIDVPAELSTPGSVLILESEGRRARVVVNADKGRFPWTAQGNTNVSFRRENEVSS